MACFGAFYNLCASLFAQKEQQGRKQTINSNNKQTLTKQTGINAS